MRPLRISGNKEPVIRKLMTGSLYMLSGGIFMKPAQMN